MGGPRYDRPPVDSPNPGRVALAHDYINQFGGAERVVLEMARMWPQAPIYTSLYRPASSYEEFGRREIRTSFLDRAPVDSSFRALTPLYPLAFRSFTPVQADVLISSSSGWAHGIRVEPGTTHVVYCHSPARWLYSTSAYIASPTKRAAAAPLLSALRRWDQRAATRADGYIANSNAIRDSIKDVYGLDAEVVYPPVDTRRFTPTAPGERLLVVSRLLAYKRVDLAVKAATRAHLPLDVIGDGPLAAELRSIAGPSVRFLGRLPDDEVTGFMQQCRAVILPGREDFGIVPVEAAAAGKPTVAFGLGGALETIKDGATGVLFPEATVESLTSGLERLKSLDSDPADLAAHAEGFSLDTFRDRLIAAVARIRPRP